MPRHSHRAVQLVQLEGWVTRYFNRQTRRHRVQRYDNLRISRHDMSRHDMSRHDMVIGTTSCLFIKHLMKRLERIKSNRYLHRPKRRTKAEADALIPRWVLDDSILSDRNFKTLYRLTRQSFTALLHLIEDNPIFYNNSHCPQRPVKRQLQITLYHFGSGPSHSRIRTAIQFGCSEGTVHLYVKRVTTAILDHQDEYIQWPTPNSLEYRQIIERHHLKYGFPNCLGFVDGTTTPVYRKPTEQGEQYFNRKSNYALNTTIIVDSTTKILFVVAGSFQSQNQN